MIVAHLDLDAFYAAVEELENPELRSQPLIVGGDPRGRGVVATANYVARRFGIHSAMSAAEAIRRCPHAVFVRPRHSLYREYSRHVWSTVRGVVPTVEQTGLDEGYLDLGEVAARLPRGARRRRGGADVRARRDEPHVLARRRAVQGRREGRERRAQARRARRRRAGAGGGFLAPLDVRKLPGVGPKAEAAAARRGRRRRSARSRRSPTTSCAGCCPAASARCCATARAASTRAGSSSRRERISISVENTFERDLVERERLHDELRGMAREVAEHLQKTGQVARTVTTKLRYADFSIRSRSTSLDVGIDDAAQIADLACRLLDRGLRDRPGRCASSASASPGSCAYRQLALDAG